MLDPLDKASPGSPPRSPSLASNEGNKPEWVSGMPETLSDQPPVARIVSQGIRGETVAEGLPYFVTWDPTIDPFEESLDLPPWPEAVPTGKNRTLRFLTQARTHLIIVSSGPEIDTVTNEFRGKDPEFVWECTQSQENPCERVNPGGFIEYHRIPSHVLQNPYISVFAMWSVPPEIVDGKFIEGTSWFASANWLFHLTEE